MTGKKREKRHYFCVLEDGTEKDLDAWGPSDADRKLEEGTIIIGTSRVWKDVEEIPPEAETFQSALDKMVQGKTRVRVYAADPYQIQDGVFLRLTHLAGCCYIVLKVGEEEVYVYSGVSEIILLED